MSFLTQEEEDQDSYGSWKVAIAWMREQHEAGVPIGKMYREAEERQRRKLPDVVIEQHEGS